MKRLLMVLVLIALLTGVAQAQDTSRHQIHWTQPDTTCTGNPTQDGWLKEYRIYVASPTDTLMVGLVDAPFAVADTVHAYVNLTIGVPQSIQVLAVDIWDRLGCKPSEWSDSYIPLPEVPGEPGRVWVDDQ